MVSLNGSIIFGHTDCLVLPKREGNNCPKADPTGLADKSGWKIHSQEEKEDALIHIDTIIVAVVRPLKSNHASENLGPITKKIGWATPARTYKFSISLISWPSTNFFLLTCPIPSNAFAAWGGRLWGVPATRIQPDKVRRTAPPKQHRRNPYLLHKNGVANDAGRKTILIIFPSQLTCEIDIWKSLVTASIV